MRSAIVVFLISCLGCSPSPTKSDQVKPKAIPHSKYIWTQVLDSANWKKNYNFQLLSVRDTLWVFHPDACWYSVDEGQSWVSSALANIIDNHAFLDYVVFKDAVYGLGYFKGNIENFVFKPNIYRTSDMQHWEVLSTKSNIPDRFFYHPFVFKDKLWIIGGEDEKTAYADIWNSKDGIQWIKQKQDLPFGKRSGSIIVTLNEKLYLLNSDVWSSIDGLNWVKETDAIVPGQEIFGYNAVVFDGKIWLLGCNRNGQFSSQVLVSRDGKNWEGIHAPWSPRGGIAATVHHNKIFMTGGKYGGTPNHTTFIYSNDLWVLHKNEIQE